MRVTRHDERTSRDPEASAVTPVSAGHRSGWSRTLLLLVIGGVIGAALVASTHMATSRDAAPAQQAAASAAETPAVTTGLDMCAPATGPDGTTAPMFMSSGGLQMIMYPTTCTAPTWAEFDRVHAMLARAKAATDKYRDFNVAVQDGYSPTSLAFVQGQGYHYENPSYIDRGFDLLHPPFLVYGKDHGRLVLQGLMYYVPATTTVQQLAAIFPPSMASWHQHINLCLANDAVLPIYTAAACAQKGGYFLPKSGWMVHAWLWRPHSGIFTIDM